MCISVSIEHSRLSRVSAGRMLASVHVRLWRGLLDRGPGPDHAVGLERPEARPPAIMAAVGAQIGPPACAVTVQCSCQGGPLEGPLPIESVAWLTREFRVEVRGRAAPGPRPAALPYSKAGSRDRPAGHT